MSSFLIEFLSAFAGVVDEESHAFLDSLRHSMRPPKTRTMRSPPDPYSRSIPCLESDAGAASLSLSVPRVVRAAALRRRRGEVTCKHIDVIRVPPRVVAGFDFVNEALGARLFVLKVHISDAKGALCGVFKELHGHVGPSVLARFADEMLERWETVRQHIDKNGNGLLDDSFLQAALRRAVGEA